MTTAQEYAEQAGDIFVLPDTSLRIKQLIDDDSATMQDMAEIINYDPILAGQLLKLANSALYRFPNTIVTLNKALQVIGTASMYDLIVAYSVAKAFSAMEIEAERLERFWELSVSAGLLAKCFADGLKHKESERLFVSGLLHNIGELVVFQITPQKAQKCGEFSLEKTPLMLQQQELGCSYAEIGAELIRLWGIPSTISDAVNYQWAASHPAANQDQHIMQLSVQMAWENHFSDIYQGQTYITEDYFKPLGLSNEDCQEAMDFANLQSFSVMQLFSPSAFAMY